MTSSSAWPSRPFLAPGFRFAGWRPEGAAKLQRAKRKGGEQEPDRQRPHAIAMVRAAIACSGGLSTFDRG